jgi:AcrR family transcriptional regulator
MGRAPLFSDTQILDATTAHVATHGPKASVSGVAKMIGAPSGSIYYRFANRDALVATAWLRAVSEFQRGFLAALDDPDVDAAAVAAATHVPRWCGQALDQAILLHRYRLEDLVEAWPEALVPERATVNQDLYAALRRHALARYGSPAGDALDLTRFALVDVPGAAVRRFLDRRHAPPPWSIDAVGVAALAILESAR